MIEWLADDIRLFFPSNKDVSHGFLEHCFLDSHSITPWLCLFVITAPLIVVVAAMTIIIINHDVSHLFL